MVFSLCFCFVLLCSMNATLLCVWTHAHIWVRVCDNVWVVNMHVHLWMLMSVHVEPKAGGGQSDIDNFLYYSFPCCFETFSHWNWSSLFWRSFRTSDWIHWHRQACHSVYKGFKLEYLCIYSLFQLPRFLYFQSWISFPYFFGEC